MTARPARALWPALLLVAWLGCGEPPPRSALLLTLDTTRSDLLGSYAGRGVTPTLDALAAESVRYRQAITTAPYTGPSHASMLTGLAPPRHGLRDYLAQRLPGEATTLAEILGERGFATAAFVSTAVLARDYGLDQGFDVYDEVGPKPDGSSRHWRPGGETVEAAIAWLEARDPAQPFLLWVHLYDAHGPYMPPPRYRSPLPRGVQPGSPDAKRQRYYEQGAVLDDAAATLFDALRRAGVWERLVVAVASDHGELLGYHGRKLEAHSNSLVDATLRVPMLVRAPGRLAPGVEDTAVGVIDLLPTVLDALDVPIPPALDGRSLLAGPPPDRSFYSETFYEFFGRSPDGEELAALRRDGWKLVARPGRVRLFDLTRDPDELVDRAAEEPERVAALLAELDARRRHLAAPADALPEPEQRRREEALRALGYVE